MSVFCAHIAKYYFLILHMYVGHKYVIYYMHKYIHVSSIYIIITTDCYAINSYYTSTYAC